MLMHPAHRFAWGLPGNGSVILGHPQGIIYAPPGALCLNPYTGRYYRKIPPPNDTSGNSSPYGWYKEPHPMLDQWFAHQARGSSSFLSVNGINNNSASAVTGTWLGMSNLIPVSSYFQNGWNWLRGATAGALGNTVCAGFGTDGFPGGDTNTGASGAHDLDVDCVFDLMLGLDLNEGTATTLANARWWVVVAQGTGGAYAAPANSAVMKTAFAGFVSAGSSMWGFRYSPTVDGDTGFVPMAADSAGVTLGTAIGGTPAQKTPMRFRIRVVHVDPQSGGAAASYFSINDGVEQKITGNMATSGGAMIQPCIAIYQTAADAPGKTMAFRSVLCFAGNHY